MTTKNDPVRFLCLLDELDTSRELLKSGFGHLQEIDMGSTFYHLPHQLLASGFERLMKCYIAVVRKGRDGAYPDRAAMKSLGHDLESLSVTGTFSVPIDIRCLLKMLGLGLMAGALPRGIGEAGEGGASGRLRAT